jgi:hypothetical protein
MDPSHVVEVPHDLAAVVDPEGSGGRSSMDINRGERENHIRPGGSTPPKATIPNNNSVAIP